MRLVVIVFLIVSLFFVSGCSNLQRVGLETGERYGYSSADIVLLDTAKEIEPGDIVLYSYKKNGSFTGALGPDQRLIKIIGVPGDKVRFDECSYESNGFLIPINCSVGGFGTMLLLWGNTRHKGVADMELVVPDGEYLAEGWRGVVSVSDGDEKDSTRTEYNRYTVRGEAITGVVVKKLRHDSKLEEELRSRQY